MNKPQFEIPDRNQEGDITTFDLAELPPPLQKLLRVLLRKIELDFSSLLEAANAFPMEDRLDNEELELALYDLSEKGWLNRNSEGDAVYYKVNLRKKDKRRNTNSIWSMLDD